MSFDIYGNNLKRGHCEVHSHIAEEYPCSVCMQESQLKKVASNAQLKQWELEDLVQVLESRIKELENTRTQSQCELYDELYKAALGLSYGVDWNNGTHAITHGYRDRLINAVSKIKAGNK